MGEPFAGHGGTVAHGIEGRIVDGGCGRQVEQDDGDAGAADDGEHGGGKGVGGDVEEDEVDVGLAEGVGGGGGFFGVVDEAQVDDVGAGGLEVRFDAAVVGKEAVTETGELGPIGVEAGREEANAVVLRDRREVGLVH